MPWGDRARVKISVFWQAFCTPEHEFELEEHFGWEFRIVVNSRHLVASLLVSG